MNVYEERCVNQDIDGLVANDLHGGVNLLVNDCEQLVTEDGHEKEAEMEQQEEDHIIQEEEEYRTKDPVKKYHLNYDQSIAMSNMHPEVTEKDNRKEPNMVSVAPAEAALHSTSCSTRNGTSRPTLTCIKPREQTD